MITKRFKRTAIGRTVLGTLLLACACAKAVTPTATKSAGVTPTETPRIRTDCIQDRSPTPRRVYACGDLTFDVSIPEQCASQNCGLIFDVHGLTMNGRMEDNNTNLAARGREHGYVVVQPNASLPAPMSSWDRHGADDAAVFAFMQQAIEAFHIDKAKVHITGFSQGGDMTWRFICKHSDILASAAPAAFGLSKVTRPCFTGPRKHTPPILFMAGRRDALVNFSIAKEARDAVVASAALTEAKVVERRPKMRRTRYSNQQGDVLEFIEHRYESNSPMLDGHCFPGSTDRGEAAGLEPGQLLPLGCEGPSSFDWGEEVIRFFIAHPQKGKASAALEHRRTEVK